MTEASKKSEALSKKHSEYAPHFNGTNFGTRDFVDLIYEGLQKVVCGWWTGHTLQCIMRDMGFICINDHEGSQTITQKGQQELWDLYVLHKEIREEMKEDAQKELLEECERLINYFYKITNNSQASDLLKKLRAVKGEK